MRHTLFIYLISLVLLTRYGLGANPHGMGRSQEVSHTAYYEVFPSLGTDYGDTGAFIMKIVKTDDPKPYTDSNNMIVSWTVEANNNQVDQLLRHPGIKRLARVSFPALPQKRADAMRPWMVAPTDAYNKAQLKETAGFLKGLTTSPLREYDYLDAPHPLFYWQVNITEAQRDQAVQHTGIAWADPADGGTVAAVSSRPKQRRDVTYAAQRDAVAELVAISQPSTITDISYLRDYVYEDHGGSESFIYHVETGVNYLKYPAEFPHYASAHILTPLARSLGRKPEEDHWETSFGELPFHGTCTAGKALGQQYGASKRANLVVVAMADCTVGEITAAFAEIAKDIRLHHPERRKHSVVTMSITLGKYDPSHKSSYEALRIAIQEVMSLDVPVVVPAGNHGTSPGRRKIDTVPGVFALLDRSFPLIVVGSVNAGGVGSPFSQLGGTINAVGEGITCITDSATSPATGLEGTSYAAPMVAGEIANLLSYDKVPIDTSDGQVVKNMRDYLETSDTAGWVRTVNLRVLWNGVTEANNPKVPKMRCYGLAGDRYVGRETLRSVIEDEFCEDAVQHGSISRRYKPGTMDEVTISVNYKDPNKPRNRGDCVLYLLGSITDICDANDPVGNPANYKGGGELDLDDVRYYIEPQALVRQPARLGLAGGCSSTEEFLWDAFWVWGHGWASDDFGDALEKKLSKFGLTEWDFEYGLGDDGREWTATFHTVIGQKEFVQAALKEAGHRTASCAMAVDNLLVPGQHLSNLKYSKNPYSR